MQIIKDTTNRPQVEELQYLFAQTSWANDRTIEGIAAMLHRLTVFVCIRDQDKLIGFGRALTDGIYRALLDDIIVDANYRKSGIGTLIMDTLLEQLADVEEVFLNTGHKLKSYYERFGFEKSTGLTMNK